jgi:hypothetical protein
MTSLTEQTLAQLNAGVSVPRLAAAVGRACP